MNDTAETTETFFQHDWRQFVIIPVGINNAPMFCARCPRCNKYYTQELFGYLKTDYTASEPDTFPPFYEGQLHLPEFGCAAPPEF